MNSQLFVLLLDTKVVGKHNEVIDLDYTARQKIIKLELYVAVSVSGNTFWFTQRSELFNYILKRLKILMSKTRENVQ